MPATSTSGRDTRSSSSARLRRPRAAGELWPPSSQSSAAGAASLQRAGRGPAAACAPASRRESGRARSRRRRIGECAWRAEGGDGGAGIVDLMSAEQARARQVEQARFVRETSRPCSSKACQSWPDAQSGAPTRAGLALDHVAAPAGSWRRDDRRHAALQDAGLLGGDLGRACRRGSCCVVERDRRDHGTASGRSITLVASSRPPRPTSSSSTVGRHARRRRGRRPRW